MTSETTDSPSKYQKLAEKMRCGIQIVPNQSRDGFFHWDEDEKHIIAACALGHVKLCIAQEIDTDPVQINLTEALENMGFTHEEATWFGSNRVQSLIVHWNDVDRLSSAEIADRLDNMTDETLAEAYKKMYNF